tara:strand:+ start:21753 stop:22763 length:1011 start_codon:yes stop_codon:yes gene_type:complete
VSLFIPTQDIYIQGPAGYLPSRVMTNHDLVKWLDATVKPEWIQNRTGIEKRHWVEDNEALSDLALACLKKFKKTYPLDPNTLSQLIVATISGDYPSPPVSPIIQDKAQLKNIGCFDLGAACAGFVTGLITAAQLATAQHKDILLIAADIRSKFLSKRDLSATSLFGDGAACSLISPNKKSAEFKFIAGEMYSDGSVADIIAIQAGGSRTPAHLSQEPSDHFLKMKSGPKLFVKAVSGMVESSRQILKNTHLTLEDIDWVVPHQANLHLVREVARQLELPNEKVIEIVQKTGNTAGASTGLALSHLLQSNHLKSADKILLISAGGGGLAANVVLERV